MCWWTGGPLATEDDDKGEGSLHLRLTGTHIELSWTIQMINYNLILFNERFTKNKYVVRKRQILEFRSWLCESGKPLPEVRGEGTNLSLVSMQICITYTVIRTF